MGNNTFFSVQYDGDGNEVEPEDKPSIETSEEFNSREQASAPVSINGNQHQFRMRVGADLERELHLADAQEKIDAFQEELDRVEVLRASGEPVSDATRRRIRGTMTDIAIAYVDRAGGDLNDPELAALRARVGALIGK